MKIKTTPLLILGGVFFILDRFLKNVALSNNQPHLFWHWFGWRPFLNPGVAFGLPLPQILKIILSIIIIALFVWLVIKAKEGSEQVKIAGSYIVLGAISNFYDRLVYQATVDYIQVLTGIFNLADGLILVGFIWFFFLQRQKEPTRAVDN